MDETDKQSVIKAADHWARLADDEERMALYEEEHGRVGVSYRNRADRYRRTAQVLRLEAETGKPHCNCHMKPDSECPNGQMGLRF